ncbi:MAG TPA: hypothetical protein VN620_15615, partial [Candidatus Methylomirabilis sp.]|nr:hypothetical protein [Candidatus Methylomirabilis sp.]
MQYAEEHQASGGLSIPTDSGVVSGNFDSHNQQQVQQRSQFCSDSSKQFSQSSNEFLFVKEGDPTLVNGFNDCLKNHRVQFLTTSGKLETSNVFSVSVGAQFYPGPEPRIISVTAV